MDIPEMEPADLLEEEMMGALPYLDFPDSAMEKFMVDYWAPEGTRIEQVAADLRLAERKPDDGDDRQGQQTLAGRNGSSILTGELWPAQAESPVAVHLLGGNGVPGGIDGRRHPGVR